MQFIKINKEKNDPEFDRFSEWIEYAINNNILYIDGTDLIWGHRDLDRRIKPGSWILRSYKNGMLKFRSDSEFKDTFEVHEENTGT